MNDEMGELKARLRRIEETLTRDGVGADRVALAQAVSRARRLLQHADRTRAPSTELRTSVERAELLVAPH
ncbi:MAG TPA: hypothetical protein VFK85_01525 [Anaeromyxobacteraceae bacterium]|nr:hypothetical protein [Anaeromyxobacteraceae bacterium]